MLEPIKERPVWITYFHTVKDVIKGIISTPKEIAQLKAENAKLTETCNQCYQLIYDVIKQNKEAKEQVDDLPTKSHINGLTQILEKHIKDLSAKLTLDMLALEERIQLVESILVEGICKEFDIDDTADLEEEIMIEMDEETEREIKEVQELEEKAKPKKRRTRKSNK